MFVPLGRVQLNSAQRAFYDAAAAASKQLDLIHGAGRSTRMEIQFADLLPTLI
jgi:hypothetical protein